MRYWWVNQNQTYRAEVCGSFMWSPKQNANGARNQFYENMREMSPGDVVFSFCDSKIKAIGVVTGAVQTRPKPDFGSAGANWSQEGWFVPVDYCLLENLSEGAEPRGCGVTLDIARLPHLYRHLVSPPISLLSRNIGAVYTSGIDQARGL